MGPDVILTIGLLLSAISIPPVFGALADGRPPRVGALVFIIGMTAIAVAALQKPGGYEIVEIPRIVIDVLSGAARG